MKSRQDLRPEAIDVDTSNPDPFFMCFYWTQPAIIAFFSIDCHSGGLKKQKYGVILTWNTRNATCAPLCTVIGHPSALASEKELSDFLKNVEKRAFKRSIYHVRDEEAALDIVQDSMMKLAEHYADKPANELPMLFQRILSNTTLDWFRRQKTKNALFSNFNEFESESGSDELDFLEIKVSESETLMSESAEQNFSHTQNVQEIE